MPSTIPVRFKATSECFDIPYRMQTTILQLIEYVCRHSTVILNANPDHYYLANEKTTFDNHRTVEETDLNQPDQYNSLSVCVKTRLLMTRILQNHEQLRQIPPKIFQRTQQASSVEESKKISSSAAPQSILTPTAATSNDDDDDVNSEVHILICGGPLVGKSSLINALCGCPVAKTNIVGLDLCTQKSNSYQLGNIFFWDTPGIQQWSHLDIDSYLHSSIRRQTPICMFYCASPGSFTKLKQLDMLLDECIRRRHIFCALVVTNMFAHVDRHAILEEFKALLTKYIDHENQIREEHGVWYYGKVGLCTMINSQEYIDEDAHQRKPQQGINELVLGVIKSLSERHQLGAWLRTIEYNRQFWLDKQEELYKLTGKPRGTCLSEMT